MAREGARGVSGAMRLRKGARENPGLTSWVDGYEDDSIFRMLAGTLSRSPRYARVSGHFTSYFSLAADVLPEKFSRGMGRSTSQFRTLPL